MPPRRVPPLAALLVLLASAGAATAQGAGWRTPIPRSLLYDEHRQGELYAVEFLNRHVGWAVGGHGNATMVFRTVDGAKTWERLRLFDGADTPPSFHAIAFADARNGWMAGDAVLRTTDGGESWEPVDVEPASYIYVRAMLVLAPDVVILGSKSRNGRQLHVTANGGMSWLIATVSEHGNDDVTALAVGPDGSLYATTGSMYLDRGGLHRSTDGGKSWEPVVQGSQPLRSISFAGERGVAGGDGVVYWTADGGATWKRAVAPGRREAIAFVDETHVLAAGTGPHLLLSEDGGRTWVPGPGPAAGETGVLVDIALVDPGWWFAAGGRGANALFHFVDPEYLAPVAAARIPLPVDVTLPGGRALPRGLYDVLVGHRGDEHVLTLGRTGELPEPEPGSDDAGEAELPAEEPPACMDPCTAELPVEVEYGVEELDPSRDSGQLFALSVEPTATGLMVVLDAAATPPRDLRLALAAIAAPQEVDTKVASAAQATKEKAGGLFGRIRKAASGDVRGAVAGAVANPRDVVDAVTAAKSAPPAVYRIRLRYMLDLFAPAGAP